MAMKKAAAVLLFLAQTCLIQATEVSPWFGQDLEIEARVKDLYRHSDRIDIDKDESIAYHADSNFLNLGASMAALSVWNIELEAILASTRVQTFNFDNGRLTLSHLFLNDNVNDPVSLAAGVTISGVSASALRDPNSIHHGRWEFYGHASVGKQWLCKEFWTSRIWGEAGVGIADRGSPWMQAHVEYEKNLCDLQQYGCYLEARWGFGNHPFPALSSFYGYSNLRYQLYEVGVKYARQFECIGKLTFEYNYRFYARNTLENCHTLALTWMFPVNPLQVAY